MACSWYPVAQIISIKAFSDIFLIKKLCFESIALCFYKHVILPLPIFVFFDKMSHSSLHASGPGYSGFSYNSAALTQVPFLFLVPSVPVLVPVLVPFSPLLPPCPSVRVPTIPIKFLCFQFHHFCHSFNRFCFYQFRTDFPWFWSRHFCSRIQSSGSPNSTQSSPGSGSTTSVPDCTVLIPPIQL